MGIGDWVLKIAQSQIPNPQSPIPKTKIIIIRKTITKINTN